MSTNSGHDCGSSSVEEELLRAARRQKEPSRGSDARTTTANARTETQATTTVCEPVMSSARLGRFLEVPDVSVGSRSATPTDVGTRPCRSGGGQAAIFENMDLFSGYDSWGQWAPRPNAYPACRTDAVPPATHLVLLKRKSM